MAGALPIIREARLGSAPPRATLRFFIPKNGGSTVDARLSLESDTVASWKSSEILGKTTEEELLPKGLYSLEVNVAFTKSQQAQVDLEFSTLFRGNPIRRRVVSLSGTKDDLARVFAILRIEIP